MRKILFTILMFTFTLAYSQDEYELKKQDGIIYCESDGINEWSTRLIYGQYGVIQFEESPSTPYFYIQIASPLYIEELYDKEYVVTIKTDKDETISFKAKMHGLTDSFGDIIRMYFGVKSFKNGERDLAIIFRGNISSLKIKKESGSLSFDFDMKTKETLPKMINSIEEKSGKRFSSDFKRNVGMTTSPSNSQGSEMFSASSNKIWPKDYCYEEPMLCHDKHPKSQHVASKTIQWAMDSWIDTADGSNTRYTMYYTRSNTESDKLAVSDIYFVPTDYNPVVQNGVEITSPPKVLYFTLHPDQNQLGAWVEEIVKKSDNHLYKIQKELIFDEVLGDRIFFFLTNETQYKPAPKLSPKDHKIYSSKPQKTIITKIR